MTTALITGITGFAGSHLADYLIQHQPSVRICGFVRTSSSRQYLQGKPLRLFEGDLQDYGSLVAALDEARPDYVFHLAARTNVQYSFANPLTALQDNCVGTVNLLEAVRFLKREKNYDPLVHVCSSSDVYGQAEEHELPITERNPLRPRNPYAVSKACEDMYAAQYHVAWGLRTVRSRAFSHEGPRRSPTGAVSGFCRQVAAIEHGVQEPVLNVGNLEGARTFCDVRDVVEAYWLLATRGQAGEVYNICGTETLRIREVVDLLLRLARVPIEFRVDPARLRPSDSVVQVPSCEKFHNATGWRPRIPFAKTLEDLLNYWRHRVRVEQLFDAASEGPTPTTTVVQH